MLKFCMKENGRFTYFFTLDFIFLKINKRKKIALHCFMMYFEQDIQKDELQDSSQLAENQNASFDFTVLFSCQR